MVDLRTLKPLDIETIARVGARRPAGSSSSTRARVTGGFASEVVARVVEAVGIDAFRSAPVRVTAKDTPIPYATALEREVLPQVDDVVAGVCNAMGSRQRRSAGLTACPRRTSSSRQALRASGPAVAVVTGGASGLGAAIAAGLAQAGAAIVVVDIDDERAADVVRRDRRRGRHGRAPFTADVTDRRQSTRRRRRGRRRSARVDVLVNSAGTAFRSPAEELPRGARSTRVVALNLKGTFLTCQRVRAPDARPGRGQHRQHRVDRRLHRLPAHERLPGEQGRRRAARPARSRSSGSARRARERDRADALSTRR